MGNLFLPGRSGGTFRLIYLNRVHKLKKNEKLLLRENKKLVKQETKFEKLNEKISNADTDNTKLNQKLSVLHERKNDINKGRNVGRNLIEISY